MNNDIEVKYIPHRRQRYDTCGDWWYEKNGTLQIRVSLLPDRRMMEAVALHEQVEAMLCAAHGIKEEDVSAFDIEFESTRARGNTDEPGDHPDAPYYAEHQVATLCEMSFITKSGVSWKAYEAAVNNLPEWRPGRSKIRK